MGVENFSILEAVEIAVGIEEEGIRFYTLAAEQVDDPGLKELFETLKEKDQTGAVITFRDVRRERELKRRLAWKASRDDLTGLLNRSEFRRCIATTIESTNSQVLPSTPQMSLVSPPWLINSVKLLNTGMAASQSITVSGGQVRIGAIVSCRATSQVQVSYCKQ